LQKLALFCLFVEPGRQSKRGMLYPRHRNECYRKVTVMNSVRTLLSSILVLSLSGLLVAPTRAEDDLLITEFMAQNVRTLATRTEIFRIGSRFTTPAPIT